MGCSDWPCLDCAVDFSPGGVWIGYIRPGLEDGSLIDAALVTGSLVSSTLFSCRDVYCTAGFSSIWTFCGTDCVLLAGCPLTPRRMGASSQPGETGAAGGHPRRPDLSREGPFDVLQDCPDSGASPRVLDGVWGCQYRITSYDEAHGGPDFMPAYGIQLHDPRLLEYMGAPESVRLLSRSPEYWLHHLGHEKTLSAGLQLQHDAGLWSERAGVTAVRHGT